MKIRNVSGEDKVLPWLDRRLVLAGAVVEVPEEHAFAYTSQEGNWVPADDEAQVVHDRELARLIVDEEEQVEPDDGGDISLVVDNDNPDEDNPDLVVHNNSGDPQVDGNQEEEVN